MATQTELNNVLTIAVKEFDDNIKSKRFILIGVLYMGMALLLTDITVLLYHCLDSAILLEHAGKGHRQLFNRQDI